LRRLVFIVFVLAFFAAATISKGKTMLYYDAFTTHSTSLFQKPEGAGFEIQCDGGEAIISFQNRFTITIPFSRDASGYEGLKLDLETDFRGSASFFIRDCLGEKYRISRIIDKGKKKISLPFADFTREGNDGDNNVPASLESLEIRIENSEAAGKGTFIIKSLTPYGSKGLSGPSVAVDAAFEFYKEKSWNDWAREIRDLGFTSVHLILVKRFSIDEQKRMVDAFHGAGLAVALRLYPTTDFDQFEKHPEWRQISLDGSSKHDWRVYLCPNAEGFTEYICNQVEKTLGSVDYDALELAEPWFEVWGGPYPKNTNRGKYQCVCGNCREKFGKQTGVDPIELFDENSPRYFVKPENAKMYQTWQDFRVDTILRFSERIYNAAGKARPGIGVIHMHLSDCTVEPGKSREYQAMDLEEGLRRIKPDILVIEDAWQDWTRADLSPGFVEQYAGYYIQKIRGIAPGIVIKSHADIGSLKQMQRSYTWMRRFSAIARSGGFTAPVYYEYSIGNFGE